MSKKNKPSKASKNAKLDISDKINEIEKQMEEKTTTKESVENLEDVLIRLNGMQTIRFLLKPPNQPIRPIIIELDLEAKPNQKWLIVEDVAGDPKVFDLFRASQLNEKISSSQKFNLPKDADIIFPQLVEIIKSGEIDGLDGKIVDFPKGVLRIFKDAKEYKEKV